MPFELENKAINYIIIIASSIINIEIAANIETLESGLKFICPPLQSFIEIEFG